MGVLVWTIANRMAAFENYVDAAVLSLGQCETADAPITRRHPLLNGAPYRAFRTAIDLDERRVAGTFFSGRAIASRLAEMLFLELEGQGLVLDPTCGMGDLLLAYADRLPLASTLNSTLQEWGQRLAGFDLRGDLIRMTKVRLTLLAKARGGFTDPVLDVDDHFPQIRVGDALLETDAPLLADGYLFNPPFGQVVPAKKTTWSTGQVNAAAIFLDELISKRSNVPPISAVLPEVLRSGTRYRRFREHLVALKVGGTCELLGRFDRWTDVDVFATLMSSSEAPQLWTSSTASSSGTVGGRFTIKVGAVVPHRHVESGDDKPFLCARTTPAGAMTFQASARRGFSGTLFAPPFVAIRRTSSPSDRCRAVGTVVVGKEPVAVENHLLVALPQTGGVKECRKLLKLLQNERTTAHLNQVIRCRHLTTAAVAGIPWPELDG